MSSQHFIQWVERQAQVLRRRLSLGPLSVLDPFKLASDMKADVISPAEIPGLDSVCINQLLRTDSDAWSAGSLRLPDGNVKIVLNPNHPDTRKRATLMEELTHIFLNHEPTQLIVVDGGPVFRTFKKTQETQAYWVGAAALVPRSALERAKTNASDRKAVANYFHVSSDLVRFRENVTGLRLR